MVSKRNRDRILKWVADDVPYQVDREEHGFDRC